MSATLLQTYQQPLRWSDGHVLVKDKIVSKDEAHQKNLLHLSSHVLILNQKNQVLCRWRGENDPFHAGVWTSTIGTHVLVGDDYTSTVRKYLPVTKEMKFIGEFRVHDQVENEVNGLFVLFAEENELPAEFLKEKKYLSHAELVEFFRQGKTTPHLQNACELLKVKKILK